MYRQVDLRSDDKRMTCWLSDDWRLAPGKLVTLKNHPEAERFWEVVRVHSHALPTPPYQPWRVGGLL